MGSFVGLTGSHFLGSHSPSQISHRISQQLDIRRSNQKQRDQFFADMTKWELFGVEHDESTLMIYAWMPKLDFQTIASDRINTNEHTKKRISDLLSAVRLSTI